MKIVRPDIDGEMQCPIDTAIYWITRDHKVLRNLTKWINANNTESGEHFTEEDVMLNLARSAPQHGIHILPSLDELTR